MSEIRYASDKPKDCKFCYYWNSRKKDCSLGKENCYYILPEKKAVKKKSPCEGCPYGAVRPCIGYCLREIQQRGVRS